MQITMTRICLRAACLTTCSTLLTARLHYYEGVAWYSGDGDDGDTVHGEMYTVVHP